jgi:dTDP-4-amino-4,6-dideoxygalactose transaminase
MDGLQGAILSVKFTHLEQWNAARRAVAEKYMELLSGIENLILPIEASYAKHVYHVFAVQVLGRDGLREYLLDKGIQCSIHYPVSIHLQEAYRFLGLGRADFPVAERCAEKFLSLPMYPDLSEEMIKCVVGRIKEALSDASLS